jgi:hypothetical protein
MTDSSDHDPGASGVGAWLRSELREFVVIAAYFYACFAALLYYQWAVAGSADPWHAGTALVKALIIAKFVMIGEVAGLGARLKVPTVLHRIVVKCFLFLLMLIVLTVLEELIVGMVHGKSLAAVLADLAQRSLPQVLANILVMLLVLAPFISFRELSQALGPGVAIRTLTSPPPTAPARTDEKDATVPGAGG